MIYFAYLFLFISLTFFVYQRLKLLLHFFQQEEYDNSRFFRLIIGAAKLIDKKMSLLLLLIGVALFFVKNDIWQLFIWALPFIIFAFFTKNPCKAGKKPLVMTHRVIRILVITFLILLIGFGMLFYCVRANFIYIALISIGLVQCLPFVLLLANFILKPVEKHIQVGFLSEAKQKLQKFNPIVIGITGSFGKTSVKHILAHILASAVPTLATPGSINTLMGVARIIREKLQLSHKFFIVEMGAYKPGSIAALCDLVKPQYGILTAIGAAHYERFKNLATVAQAKFELAEAVSKHPENFLVINKDAIAQEFIEQYVAKTNNNITLVTADKNNTDNDAIISAIKQSRAGLQFALALAGETYQIQTPLYGLHQVNNIALSFILAKKIGVPVDTIISSLKTMPQIEHRLQVIASKTGPLVIDDAYNANPIGFNSALELLKILKLQSGRAIVVTPGMVELGELHDEKHFELGKVAATVADIVLVITPARIASFIAGFKQNAQATQELLTFNSFKQAKAWLDTHAKADDVILYENDLPDLYEDNLKL